MQTLYWHDYETWGITPSVDRPSQFAGVRTNLDLEIIEEPLIAYCQPAQDILPHPEACLVTGITPQVAQQRGLKECEFARQIHAALARAGTCGVGYNTLRFDDEVTRYLLYRNFYDPYGREWANGNSRWDIIDMVRLCYALRPDGIEWPMVDGKPSFKLENLTAANGLQHAAAHDAYSDVEATIAMARLIKTTQPKLYDYAFELRRKAKVAELIDLSTHKPLLHISSMFPSEKGCAGLVMPVAPHPVNKNAVIVYDLSVSPEAMFGLDAETLHRRVFTRQEDLSDSETRVPLKLVHINKSPMLATPALLDPAAETRLGIDKAACENHWQMLKDRLGDAKSSLRQTIQAAMNLSEFEQSEDPEQQLYGGFIPRSDQATMEAIRAASSEDLAAGTFIFNDKRLSDMVLRYKARNYPESLGEAERAQWQEFVRDRLQHGEGNRIQSMGVLEEKIAQMLRESSGETKKHQVLSELSTFARQLASKYQISVELA